MSCNSCSRIERSCNQWGQTYDLLAHQQHSPCTAWFEWTCLHSCTKGCCHRWQHFQISWCPEGLIEGHLPQLPWRNETKLDKKQDLNVLSCGTSDLNLWPTDPNINRDHLLIKDYLPTNFEAFWANSSWVISCCGIGDQRDLYLDLWPDYE